MAASVRKFVILIFVKASFFPQEFYEKVNVYKTFFSREEAALPACLWEKGKNLTTKEGTSFLHRKLFAITWSAYKNHHALYYNKIKKMLESTDQTMKNNAKYHTSGICPINFIRLILPDQFYPINFIRPLLPNQFWLDLFSCPTIFVGLILPGPNYDFLTRTVVRRHVELHADTYYVRPFVHSSGHIWPSARFIVMYSLLTSERKQFFQIRSHFL